MARLYILIALIFFIFTAAIVLAQQETANIVTNQAAVESEPKETATQPLDVTTNQMPAVDVENIQWVWGEVANVDATANKLSVRYLDYETDTEKEEVFLVDKSSEFENVASMEEIKTGDSAGIDYYVDKDGQRIVKSISIEKVNVADKP
jgi:hypothetical protein